MTKNKLAGETSPYLLQHSNNPVNWYPWGEEALQKARKDDKMILISIGYSACHWCHVMEHESFEDEEVAQMMNEHFISIKVDREERPDIDQIYMSAVQIMTGSGGWPLNCFALPDGRPVYGGTYFQKANWLRVLEYIAGIYKMEKSKITEQANQLNQALTNIEFSIPDPEKLIVDTQNLQDFYKNIKFQFDTNNGGIGNAPKFPMPTIWLFLMRYSHFTDSHEALEQTLLTLDKLSNGGIYDHTGGGFSRYSVDPFWKVPHFEKMLYDNAQLISVYCEAFQITKKAKYKTVVYETFHFIERELSNGAGAYFSSLDADSEGEEGKYYTWSKKEIEELLKENTELFCDYFNVTDTGNWEDGKNILHKNKNIEEIAFKYHLNETDASNRISKCRSILLKEREERIKPGLDNKILTSWNSLMLKALTDAYRVFGDDLFLNKALLLVKFISEELGGNDYELARSYKKEENKINGFLDDYAITIDALINLYKCTFNEEWLVMAQGYLKYTLQNFYDETTSMFFYTDRKSLDLIVRKMEIPDNVIPSSNSIMANNLYKLGKYLDLKDYIDISMQMLRNVSEEMKKFSSYFTNWGILLLNFTVSPVEVVISGNEAQKMRKQLEQFYMPELILAGNTSPSDLPLLKGRFPEKKTMIYVCKNYNCNLPVETVEEALEQIRQTL